MPNFDPWRKYMEVFLDKSLIKASFNRFEMRKRPKT